MSFCLLAEFRKVRRSPQSSLRTARIDRTYQPSSSVFVFSSSHSSSYWSSHAPCPRRMSTSSEPLYAPFFGFAGVASAIVFTGALTSPPVCTVQSLRCASSTWLFEHIREFWFFAHIQYIFSVYTNGHIWTLAIGSAYGTAKAGQGVAAAGVMHPEGIIKSIIPIIMVRH